MSHESSYTPANRPEVDTSRPYLVPRDSGAIEVWHVATDDDGKPVFDDKDRVVLKGQRTEEMPDGRGYPSKGAHPDFLGDDVQSYFAEQLGHSRPYARPEEFEPIGKNDTEDNQDGLMKDAIRESLEPVNNLNVAISEEVDRSRVIDHRISEISDQWRQIAYSGLMDTVQIEQLISEVAQVQEMLEQGMDANGRIRRQVSALAESLDDTKRKVINHIRQNPNADERVPTAVKRASDEAEELEAQMRNASYRDEFVREELNRVKANMTNIIHEQFGHEAYAAHVKQTLDQFGSDPSYMRGVPYMRAEGCIDTLRHVRANVEALYE